MKASLQWLQDYADLAAPPAEIAEAITFLGFEVEGMAAVGAPRLESVVVGEVLARDPHPNADKLSVCRVNVGPAGDVKTIVCGAQNYRVGDRVPVALPGALLPGNFAIRQSTIRGQLSDGMMCSGKELGIGDDASGLLILADRPAVGRPINEVLPPPDTVFDVEITPNRPDCLSHLGLARELAAWFGVPLRYPKLAAAPTDVRDGAEVPPSLLAGVEVRDPADCPLYSAHVVTGVKVGPSPDWMRQRLSAAGLRPINNIVDVTNYVMLEYGQPLHAFDARRLGGSRIVVRRAADGEKIVTLDGRERTLNGRMLVIADAHRPVVVAGIMGGEDSGVAPDTTDLVLEGAVFRPQSVRRTSRQLGLASDSSYRYERGVDPHLTREAVRRALDLIAGSAGGRAAAGSYLVGGEAPWKREIALSTGFVRERLGFDVPDAEMKESLEALELKVSHETPASGGGLAWTVSIPSWRDDLDRPIDLVEEVLRLHRTDRIPPAPVLAPGLAMDDDPAVEFNRAAVAYLAGHDFHECVNLVLRPGREVQAWAPPAAARELALANPFVEDQSHLRPSLIGGLLETLRLNLSRGVPVDRLAEAGRVFVGSNGQNWECAGAGFILTVDDERRWKRRDPPDFYTAKHHTAALAGIAGIDLERQPLAPVSHELPGWQPGHAVAAGDIARGWTAAFGLLNLAATKALGASGPVYAGMLSVLPEKLPGRGERRRYKELGLYPPALRDIALAVDASSPAATVRKRLAQIARASCGPAFSVEAVTVFDVYAGQGLAVGRKSLAFSLAFRAPDRTLTDAEVNAAFQKIQDELAKEPGFAVRK
ncbi:MAG: phenylalanine--tRNA ligase subunit beta [Opitutaceae bacterium]